MRALGNTTNLVLHAHALPSNPVPTTGLISVRCSLNPEARVPNTIPPHLAISQSTSRPHKRISFKTYRESYIFQLRRQ